MQRSEEEIRRIREARFQNSITIEQPKQIEEEVKPKVVPKSAPTILFTEEMRKEQIVHCICTKILDISLKSPYIPNGENISIINFGNALYLEMQNQVSVGKSEVKYLCECYDRVHDLKADTRNDIHSDLLDFAAESIIGLVYNAINNYYQPGTDQMFVSQFLIILAHQDKALLNKYIQMDKECMELSSHLNTIFTYIRNQAVRAIQNNDVIALNTYATYLCRILQTPEGCTAFYESQHMLSSTDSKTVLIHYAQDYLAPFFGLHPADFFTVGRSMTPDISTIHAINATREQYINMMKGVETTCTILYSILVALLKNKEHKKRIQKWIEALLIGGNELLKSNPQYQRCIPLSVFLNLEVVLYLLAKPMIKKQSFPDIQYLLSTDPTLIDEDRIQHSIEKARCSNNHEDFAFLTRCQWMLFAVLRRSYTALKTFREKICRNLAFMLPGGYQSIETVSPDRYNEVRTFIGIELTTAAYFTLNENVHRWISIASHTSQYLLSLTNQPAEIRDYIPRYLVENIESILSNFNHFVFNDSVFIPSMMHPILHCLLQCISDHSESIGAHLSVHLKADIVKAIYSVYLPSKPDEQRSLAQVPMKASDVLFSDIESIKSLLHILIQLFTEVEKVGIESSQYRKYIIAIIRLLWDNQHCAQTVQNMKNEEVVIMKFAQSLIASFSKLTDDAFAAIPEIKQLTAEMLTPEFSRLEETERDSKQLRLEQLEQSARFSFDLTDETLELLIRAAEPWREVWMNPAIMKPLSITLPRLIDQLVSPDGAALRLENPEKYHFDKNRLLSLLVKVVLLWSKEQQFIIFMTEENTLKLSMFKKVSRICSRYGLLEPFDQQLLNEFIQSIENQQSQLDQLMAIVEDAPEEFHCYITDELMNDPVQLPNSKVIVDRVNIEKALMRSLEDPYDRTYLTMDMLIPCDELRERIRQWKKDHNYPM